MSHDGLGHDAEGAPHDAGLGLPEVMSLGIALLCQAERKYALHCMRAVPTGKNHVCTPFASYNVAKTPPPLAAKAAPYLNVKAKSGFASQNYPVALTTRLSSL